jgi:hypothetical protein
MDRIDWRWTAAPLHFFSVHASIVLFFPALIVTRLSRWTFIALGFYAVYLIYCRSQGMGPIQRLRWLRLKFVVRGQWAAF